MDLKIKPSFLSRADVQQIFSAFESEKAEIFVVGGAVRDSLLDFLVHDIDFATNQNPGSIQTILKKHGIYGVPTGGAHGTITAVIEHKAFQITPYRRDVLTDGRHAMVEFGTSLKEDSLRRDFTMNALYLNREGTLFDFVDGLSDLKARRVRFIGDANLRITEDALRILRFFRFSGRYATELDSDGLKACQIHRADLKKLSRERIKDEIFKIMAGDRVTWIIGKMIGELDDDDIFDCHDNILKNLFPFYHFSDEMPFEKISNPLIRLWTLVPSVAQFLPLSRKEESHLKKLEKCFKNLPSIKEILFYFDAQVAIDYYESFLNLYDKEPFPKDAIFQKTPVFPIQSEELLARGLTGTALGRIKKDLEKRWLDSDCVLTHDDLIERIPQHAN